LAGNNKWHSPPFPHHPFNATGSTKTNLKCARIQLSFNSFNLICGAAAAAAASSYSTACSSSSSSSSCQLLIVCTPHSHNNLFN